MTWHDMREEYVYSIHWCERHIETRLSMAWEWRAGELADGRPFARQTF